MVKIQTELIGVHDPLLVAISLVVAIFASFTALGAVPRIISATSIPKRYIWVSLFGISFGTGIWAMHFIAMLAFKLPLIVHYDVAQTILSLVIAIVAAGVVGASISSGDKLRGGKLIILAVVMGSAIASMHYVGMAAMHLNATMLYDKLIVILSVTIAIVVSGVGLFIADFLKSEQVFGSLKYKIPAAIIMGAAMTSMHYTAMAGTHFLSIPNTNPLLPDGLNLVMLTVFTTITIFLIEFGVLIFSLMDELVSSTKAQVKAEIYAKRLATVVEQAEELIVITDIDGIIEYVNPAFERTSGYSKKELMGENLSLLKSGNHSNSFYKKLWKNIKSGQSFHEDFINRKKDGEMYTVIQTISPIYDDSGVITSFAAVQRDVTEQREIEQKLNHVDRVDSLGVLAGGIAHDFNNILTAILGNASMAVRKLDSVSPAYKYLERIESASHSAADLCKQMLAYSGKGKFVVKAVNLSKLIYEMAKLIEVSINKSITLNYRLDEQLPCIDADVAQI